MIDSVDLSPFDRAILEDYRNHVNHVPSPMDFSADIKKIRRIRRESREFASQEKMEVDR